MSVPLDRLYNFLHDVCKHHDILIYRFYPHGSRKISDCTPVNSPNSYLTQHAYMNMVCHDQEPLNTSMCATPHPSFYVPGAPFSVLRNITIKYGLYDRNLLLHSEKNSQALAWFEEDGAIGVYYWCHALIARDWYRYAEVDPLVINNPKPQYDFLIYNRAWSGTREYRLRFAELVADQELAQHSLMNFSAECDELDYRSHTFKNAQFQITKTDLETTFQQNTAGADSSADYNNSDYYQCGIEVVLETLFDDTRLHLTEKVFRPIACKKPFILAATPGSLKYIQSYGFKTFSDYIDESYDSIEDPEQRLLAIVALMKKLASLSAEEKQILYQNLHKICEYNHKRFFSNEFFKDIVTEFLTNLDLGVEKMKKHCSGVYFRRMLRAHSNVASVINHIGNQGCSREDLVTLWSRLRRGNSH